MLPSITPSDQQFLSNMKQIGDQITQAVDQLSSGRRINQPSDEPDQISPLLSVCASLQQTLQIETNLGQASTEASTADTALSDSVQLFDQLVTAGTQGATGTQDPAQRQALGTQVESYLEQLISFAGTQINGRYIFSGDNDTVAPYTLVQPDPNADGTVPAPIVSDYSGSASTRQIMHPNGSLFPVAQTAQQIFDNPNASAFQAVIDLRDALNDVPTVPQGDPAYNTQYDAQTAQINTALQEVKTAQDQIGQSLASYGVVENRISEATSFASNQETVQREQLSTLQDADPTTAITTLNQAILQQQEALEAKAKIPTKTLFDYLG
jgi:flagellar hook-associated protein 3 FlgL